MRTAFVFQLTLSILANTAYADGRFNPPLQQKWASPHIRVAYNPGGQPGRFNTNDAVNALLKAARKWEAVCPVRFAFVGTTGVRYGVRDGISVVTWMGDNAPWARTRVTGVSHGAIVDADVYLNPTMITTTSMLEANITHELGHVLGITHYIGSRGESIMAPNGEASDLRTGGHLRPIDASACRGLYRVPSADTRLRVY